MASSSKPEPTGVAARRSTRLAIAIPITLSGKDIAGNPFKENTRTVVVNKHGAKIVTVHHVTLGCEVEIENRALGLTARAGVVWVGDQRPQQASLEVGVQLLRAENIWGLEFPPQDWQEGAPIGAGGKKLEGGLPPPQPAPAAVTPPAPAPEADPAPADTPAALPATARAASKPAAPPPAAPRPDLPRAAPPPSADQTAADLEKMLQRFTRQVEGIAAQQTKAFQDNLYALSREVGSRTETSLHETATRAEDRTANALRELEEGVGALETRVQSRRAEAETQTAAWAELRASAGAEIEKAQTNIQEVSFQALQSATEELSDRIQKELETAVADFSAETRKNMQQEAGSAVEASRSEADAWLKAEAESLAISLKDSLQAAAKESGARCAQESARELHSLAQDLKAELARGFEERTAQARATLQEEMQAFWKGLVEESATRALKEHLEAFRLQLAASAQASSETFTRQIEGLTSEGLNTIRQDAGVLLENSRQQLQEAIAAHLSQIVLEAKEKIRQDTGAALEQSRKQWEEATAAYQTQIMQDAQGKLAYVTERLTEDSASQLTTLTEDNLELAQAKLIEASEKVLNEAEDSFRARLAEVIAPALKPNDRRSKPRFASEPTPDKP